MSVINKQKLKTYLKLNYNVLFSGLHGVGKTSVLTQVFEEEGIKWLYFSASTLDPWVDLVGVPRITTDGDHKQLELVRPKFVFDDIEVIFFDELNRAPDKVLNAIMELIQFKSINGFKLSKLRAVWGAINPEDEEDTYKVNKLDPAHLDRFHVKIDVPYKLDEEYFRKKYPDTAEKFINWWNSLSKEQRKLVSPRRLDYAADAHQNGCKLEDFLPRDSNVAQLKNILKSASFQVELSQIESSSEAIEFLKNINNITKLLDLVRIEDAIAIKFFDTYGASIPDELIEPFSEFVTAHRDGFTKITSLQALIEKLPDTSRGRSQIIAAYINNADLDIIYSNPNNSLHNDLVAILNQYPALATKLVTSLVATMTVADRDQLMRTFWGVKGKLGGEPSNVQKLLKSVSRITGFTITEHQKKFINNKLYDNKIVEEHSFL